MKSHGFLQILFTVLLAMLTVFALQQVLRWVMPSFFKETTQNISGPQPGQGFTAPTQQEIQRPLQTAVTFAPYEPSTTFATTEVATAYGSWFFSTKAGALERFDYKRMLGRTESILSPIAPVQDSERLAFVVALADQTPYVYTLVEKKDADDASLLTYRAEGQTAIITKHYTISRSSPRIELRLIIEPRGQEAGVQARVFVPAPFIAEADANVSPQGFVYTDRKNLLKQSLDKLGSQFWFVPSLVGAEDRYFVNALIGDADGFAQRAYYTGSTPETFQFIAEGPMVKEVKTWTMSFYYGPKDVSVMAPVDPRLEQTLDYGWLSPLVKLLLRLLKWIYGFVRNYGWAILLLTLLIRLLMLPMTYKGQKALEKQKEFQRKLQYIEQKYKDDSDALGKERAELTRKYGVSNVLGCLPQLIQLPILFALNRLLSTSIEMYQAPFMGWITDLSARDPYYVFPLLAGLGLLIQVSSDSDAKRGVTMLLFAALLVAVTANLSAGLTLYLCANTWLSLAQVYAQKKLKL